MGCILLQPHFGLHQFPELPPAGGRPTDPQARHVSDMRMSMCMLHVTCICTCARASMRRWTRRTSSSRACTGASNGKGQSTVASGQPQGAGQRHRRCLLLGLGQVFRKTKRKTEGPQHFGLCVSGNFQGKQRVFGAPFWKLAVSLSLRAGLGQNRRQN